MKILTVSSPGYRQLTDVFMRSVRHEPGHSLILALTDDLGGEISQYGTAEFNRICKQKLEIIIDTLKRMPTGEVLLYCDPDVVLWGAPSWFENALIHSKTDLMTQQDPGSGHCMGFIAMRATRPVIDLLADVLSGTNSKTSDQESFNIQVRRNSSVKLSYFPTNEVFCYGAFIGNMWTGQEFNFPDTMQAFHANFTIGLSNKILLTEKAWAQRKP